MKRLVLVFLILFSSLQAQKEAWDSAPQKLTTLYSAAHIEHRKGNFSGAVDALTKAINLDSNYRAAFAFRADIYRKLGEYERALENYSRSLKISDYNCFRTFTSMGYIEFELKHYAKSFELFDALEKEGVDVGVKYMKGVSAYKLRKYKVAIKSFDKCINFPQGEANRLSELEQASAYYYRGDSKRMLGLHVEAVPDYDIVILRMMKSQSMTNKKSQVYANAYYERGLSKKSLKRPYVADFYKACELGLEEACFLDPARSLKTSLGDPESVTKVSLGKCFKKGVYDSASQSIKYKNTALKVDSQQYKDNFIYEVIINASELRNQHKTVRFNFDGACVPVRFWVKYKGDKYTQKRLLSKEVKGKSKGWYTKSTLTLFDFDEIEYFKIIEDECGLGPVKLEMEFFSGN